MFELHSLILFISAGLLLNLTPGPDVLYIVARSTGQGRQAGIVSVLGISAGCLVHIVAAAAGLSALMMALPAAYEVMRYLGAAYLIFLGLRKLFTRRARVVTSRVLPAQSLRRIFWQGVLTNVLNPKVALFFLAFLPQFTSAAHGSLPLQFLVLGAIFEFNGSLVNLGYALVASRLGDWLRARWGAAGLLDRLTGAIFVGLGLRLACLRRT
jgi:threonine/homoserine/homoserine lactone efflux protein